MPTSTHHYVSLRRLYIQLLAVENTTYNARLVCLESGKLLAAPYEREMELDHDILIRCGFNKPLYNVALSDKVDVVQTVVLQHVILDCLGELTQFKGLNSLGVGEALVDHPALMRPFYCTDYKERIGAGMQIYNTRNELTLLRK